MRLREKGRQNSPGRKSAKELERERKRLQQTVPQKKLGALEEILEKHKIQARPKIKPLPKGVPVPRNYKISYRPLIPNYVYTEAQIAAAKNILKETDLWRWPSTARSVAWSTIHNRPSYRLANVYEVRRDDQEYKILLRSFHDAGLSPNVQRMYHGTKGHSLAGIALNSLIQGSHGMFGGGIYVAPNIHKAFGYTDYGDSAFVFLADVIVGNPFVADKADKTSSHEEMWGQGFNCIHGKARHTESWSNKQTLNYDEYCIFYHNQVCLRLLARFERVANPPK